ncbi:MAG TPA: YhdP family protein [Burkholderiales bacterium]|nr:YhdP family protein [Burkholderiales bacterium]
MKRTQEPGLVNISIERSAAKTRAQERLARWREQRWYRWLRRTGWVLVGLYFIAALGILAVRFLVIPEIHEYREDIAAAASQATGLRVSIDAVSADWHALHPRVQMQGVRIYDKENREVLALPQVRAVIAWRSVFLRFMHFRSLELDGLDVAVRRSVDGKIYIAGLDATDHTDTRIGDWVLEQGNIYLHQAQITWTDEKRNAPPLHLRELDLLLTNEGNHHRFAISAKPPAEFASTIDLRGDLQGKSAAQLREWNGRFYASFEYLDLAAWHPWIDYPFELGSGRGALRMWLGFAQDRLVEAHAQVALADVSARFAKQLPRFELQTVQGEVGAQEKHLGFSIVGIGKPDLAYDAYAKGLTLVSRDGVKVAPSDFNARYEPADDAEEERGQLRANALSLQPLANLSEYLPLPQKLRTGLQEIDPRGQLEDIAIDWQGPFDAPRTYTARARFQKLGMQPFRGIPGFSNLAGSAEATEKGGRIVVDARDSEFEYAHAFPEPIHADTVYARIAWQIEDGATKLQLEKVSAANADVTANVNGTVNISPDGHAMVDLQGTGDRIRAAAMYRYIPYLGEATTTWIRESLPAGMATAMKFRMKGAGKDFPYPDPKTGQFKLSAQLNDMRLLIGEGWPAIEKIDGDIAFDGPGMTVRSSQAQLMGAKLIDVRARIGDLFHHQPVLQAEGDAEAPTNEFLKFVANSPVKEMIGGFSEDWTASGNGKLHLALDMNLATNNASLRGNYEMFNNSLALGAAIARDATITKINGAFDFTEKSAHSKGIRGHFLGGPINLQIATQQEAIVLAGQGSADVSGVVRMTDTAIADRVRGMMPYRLMINTKQKALAIESSLQGVSIDLPAPLGKSAQEVLPLRVERTLNTADRQNLNATLGKVLQVQSVLRKDGTRYVLDRAGVTVGDMPLAKPDGPYVAFAGRFDTLDLDQALALTATRPGAATAPSGPSLGTVDLKANTLMTSGRVFNDVNLRAQLRGNTWRADVNARQLAGEVLWLPEGAGLVRARLQYLINPEQPTSSPKHANTIKQLPALDIIADSYTVDDHNLGRLELQAVNEPGLWRIQRASISAPEGVASVSGTWRTASEKNPERTNLDVDLQINDIGRYLSRLGYIETMSRGEGSLKGQVSWQGPPFALDFGSLQGEIALDARNGQFVKLKPGIGKLLGVLSLQSLPRRLVLDFRDVFSEGFAFDRIEGNATIANGIMTTKDLSMSGTSASVSISGSADLQRETQELHVRVIPTVGDSVATAAGLALLNPLVGVGAFLTQRLFRDPIGQMFAFEYAISGSWEDPKVEKLGGPPQTAPATAGAAAP